MSLDSGKRRRLICSAIAAVTLTGVLPASSSVASEEPGYCSGGVLRDYERPLDEMRPIRHPPSSKRLSFGPPSLHLARFGETRLVVGGGTVGFDIGLTDSDANPKIDWKVTASLQTVDRRGHPKKLLATSWRRLKHGEDVRKSSHAFEFEVSGKPALYRVDIAFETLEGRRLAKYGEYLRVVRPRTELRLDLSTRHAHLGDVIHARIKNFGNATVSFGHQFGVERYTGTGWALFAAYGAPLFRYTPFPNAGRVLECLPSIELFSPEFEPGFYRMVLPVEVSGGTKTGKLALTAPFEILP